MKQAKLTQEWVIRPYGTPGARQGIGEVLADVSRSKGIAALKAVDGRRQGG